MADKGGSIRLGIIANASKPMVASILPLFLEWLKKEKIVIVLADDLSAIIDTAGYATLPPAETAQSCDFVLSFGGDGTFLQTAHLIAPSEVPVIGVNLGAFGYLAEVSVDHLHERIADLQQGKYRIQDRFMLEVRVDGKNEGSFHGLNDIVLDKGDFPRTIRLETSVNGEYLNSFNADGLIVSTPTGSTGYSLSVGGPILEPEVDAMIISPINPHMLANRPLVICGSKTVTIAAFSQGGHFQVIIDGQRELKLKSGEKVTISRSSRRTRLVKFGDSTFYSLLRNKLHWRDQLNRSEERTGMGES